MVGLRVTFCPNCCDTVKLTEAGFFCPNCVTIIPKALVKSSIIEPVCALKPKGQHQKCSENELIFFRLFKFFTLYWWKKGLRSIRYVWARFLASIKTEILHCPHCENEVIFKDLTYYCRVCEQNFDKTQLHVITLWEFKPFYYIPFYSQEGRPLEPNLALAYEYGRVLQTLTKKCLAQGLQVLRIWEEVCLELELLDTLNHTGNPERNTEQLREDFTEMELTEFYPLLNQVGILIRKFPDKIFNLNPSSERIAHYCAALLYVLSKLEGREM